MQTTVNKLLAFGVAGSFYDNSPRIVDSYIVSGGAICNAFTVSSADPAKATLGGSGVFAGIAVNTKEYAITGLTASMAFEDGANAQLCTEGRIVLQLPNAVTVGQAAFFNTTTGVIQPGTSGATVTGCTEIVGSKFVLVNALANEVSVLQLG